MKRLSFLPGDLLLSALSPILASLVVSGFIDGEAESTQKTRKRTCGLSRRDLYSGLELSHGVLVGVKWHGKRSCV